MKQQRKQLEFQVNGPYRDYTLRWVRLHRENNQRLLLVLVPTVLYMFTSNPVFLLIGLCYLALALLYGKRQQGKLLAELAVLEQKSLERLEKGMDDWGIPPQRRFTFGYRRTEESFQPVLLCRWEDTLYLSGKVLVKNCIYGVDGQMLYLLDVDEQALACQPELLPLSELKWERCPLCHQDLLRQEGIRLNDFLVIESFIYGVLLEEMKAGSNKKLLHASWHLTQMRKEPVYQTLLSNGDTLLLSKMAWDLLTPEQPQTAEKAGGK